MQLIEMQSIDAIDLSESDLLNSKGLNTTVTAVPPAPPPEILETTLESIIISNIISDVPKSNL